MFSAATASTVLTILAASLTGIAPTPAAMETAFDARPTTLPFAAEGPRATSTPARDAPRPAPRHPRQGPGRTAEPPLVTDRPDFTESTEVVPPGRVQIEGGYTFDRTGDVDSHAVGELLARIPVHRRVELRAGINSFVLVRPPAAPADHSGLEDSSVGFKWKLVDGDPDTGLDRPDVALLASTTLPTGDDRLGEDELQPDVTLAMAWDLTDRVSMGTNLGYASAVDGGDRFDQGFGSLALGLAISERLGTFVEYYGFFPGSADGSDRHFVDGGITWLVDAGFQLDARIGKGLNGIDDDFFLGGGASVRF